MKFLCLCHYDASAFAAFGPAEFAEIGRICAPHDQAFKASGKVRMIGSLGLPDQSRTLRAGEAGAHVADGPYAETNEPFGAFFIIEAETIEEATEIAGLHPGTHLGHMMRGGIEIRPIEQLEIL